MTDTLGAARRARVALRGTTKSLRKPGFVLASMVLVIVVLWAIAPGLMTTGDPLKPDVSSVLQGPSERHLFGTDELGRDLYSRMVYGASVSVRSALIAVCIGLTAGSLIGLVSGYLGGRFDTVVMRLVDVLLSIPMLLVAMVLVTSLGAGPNQLAIAIGTGMMGSLARMMRSEVVRVRQLPFIDAERSLGASDGYILFRHILPNSAGPVLVLAVIELGQAVLAISALSFFGFGAPPPAPEWGAIVAAGQSYLASAWWFTTIPGLVIALVVTAVNRVAREFERSQG